MFFVKNLKISFIDESCDAESPRRPCTEYIYKATESTFVCL